MKHFILLLFVLSLCGCRSSPRPPALSGASASSSISVVERSVDFYNNLPRPISPDAFRPRVDYQSELRILVHTNELFKELSSPSSVLAKLTPEQQSRLDRLNELLQGARHYLYAASGFVREYESLKNVPATPDNQRALLNLIQIQGRAETNYLRPLIAYVDAKTQTENPTFTRSQVIRARDHARGPANNPLFIPGQDLDFAALSDFVGAESATIVRQASQDARVVHEAGSVYLHMRATLTPEGQSEVSLHIRNYDTLSDANVAQEPRVSFQMSDEDRQRLAAETQVNTEIVQLSLDLQNNKSQIRQSFDSLVSAARGDLAGWQEAATNFDKLEMKLEPLVPALDQLQSSARLNSDQKKVVSDARNLLATVTNQVRQVRETIKLFVGPMDPQTEPAAALMATVDTLSHSLEGLVNFPADLTAQVGRTLVDLQKLAAEPPSAPPPVEPDLQNLGDLLKAGAPSSVEAITNLLASILENYPALLGELGSLRRKNQIMTAASNFPPIQMDTNLMDIAAASPPDGFISLQKNVVRGHATVTLDAALVTRPDAASPATAKPVGHQEFAVEKFGLINTWSASLIFVKRLGNLDATERNVQFAPAPSISWTLHYNPPPDPTADFSPRNKFWEMVDPGAGLNVAALNWSSGVELGLGAHVSLFHDLLSVGGGCNVNESRHGGYVFIGLGLFQALNQLGITGASFPLGR